MALAKKAFALKPKHEETQDVLLRLQAESADWTGARKTLGAKLKSGSLPRDVHKRRDAVLALSEARDILDDGKTIEAREAAIQANRLSPDLIPAAIMAVFAIAMGLHSIRVHREAERADREAKVANKVSDFLEGKVAFEDQAMRLDTNTIVCCQPKPVKDPARIVTRVATGEMLDDVQARFMPDIMLFDLPPVLVSDEARAFLKLMDAAVIVAAAEQSTIAEVDDCEREVADYTQVAGIVLNKCRHMSDGYGYSY